MLMWLNMRVVTIMLGLNFQILIDRFNIEAKRKVHKKIKF